MKKETNTRKYILDSSELDVKPHQLLVAVKLVSFLKKSIGSFDALYSKKNINGDENTIANSHASINAIIEDLLLTYL